MESLTSDILSIIRSHLSCKDLVNMSLACKRLCQPEPSDARLQRLVQHFVRKLVARDSDWYDMHLMLDPDNATQQPTTMYAFHNWCETAQVGLENYGGKELEMEDAIYDAARCVMACRRTRSGGCTLAVISPRHVQYYTSPRYVAYTGDTRPRRNIVCGVLGFHPSECDGRDQALVVSVQHPPPPPPTPTPPPQACRCEMRSVTTGADWRAITYREMCWAPDRWAHRR